MKIFIDVDNTILEHYGFYSYSTEARVHMSMGRYPKENKGAIENLFKNSVCHDPVVIKNLFLQDDVFILTKFQHLDYEASKRERLASIFHMSVEELENLRDSNGNLKYIAVPENETKVENVKRSLGCDSIEDFILIDDYSQNIIEWERSGGIGIKYYNKYNSPEHPTNGISVSNFKLFEFYMGDKQIKDVMVIGNNKYKMNLLISKIHELVRGVEHIDILKEVFKDVQEKLDIGEIFENNKYSHVNFMIEYYEFMQHMKSNYWTEVFKKSMKENTFSVISSTFEPVMSTIYNVDGIDKEQLITIAITSEKQNFENTFDLYLTMSEERFVGEINDLFENVINIITSLTVGEY